MQENTTHQVYMSLGSNLGDRRQHLLDALQKIKNRIGSIVSQSDFFETEPFEMDSKHLFINMAIQVETCLSAIETLHITQDIERELGRSKKSENGIHYDRIIDIDLLIFDELTMKSSLLNLPHPHMKERAFVLIPLAQIAPQLVIVGETKTIAQLRDDIVDTSMLPQILQGYRPHGNNVP